jgi:hypothetical protein
MPMEDFVTAEDQTGTKWRFLRTSRNTIHAGSMRFPNLVVDQSPFQSLASRALPVLVQAQQVQFFTFCPSPYCLQSATWGSRNDMIFAGPSGTILVLSTTPSLAGFTYEYHGRHLRKLQRQLLNISLSIHKVSKHCVVANQCWWLPPGAICVFPRREDELYSGLPHQQLPYFISLLMFY